MWAYSAYPSLPLCNYFKGFIFLSFSYVCYVIEVEKRFFGEISYKLEEAWFLTRVLLWRLKLGFFLFVEMADLEFQET